MSRSTSPSDGMASLSDAGSAETAQISLLPQKELDAIMNGTHPEIIALHKELEHEYQRTVASIHSHKRYREEVAKKQYAHDLRNLQGEAKKAKAALRTQMVSELDKERLKLKDWYESSRIDEKDGDQRETRQTRNKKKGYMATDTPEVAGAAKGEEVETLHCGPVLQTELRPAEIDSDMSALKLPRTPRPRVKSPESRELDCVYQHQPCFDGKNQLQDRLRYDGKWYQRGYRVTAEYADGTKTTGVIYMITPDRVWLRKHDGTKFSITLQSLANRKHSMRVAQGRDM
mmetsp:Transcript_36317/g.95141  ORF Transcript_36317/g.95141 Transcript_36317/m.95141 type:complete len:287 (+) Transcript_36317:165-1025(+)